MLHAVIMAGGGGTRFWPRSRPRTPKQFLTLAGDRTPAPAGLRPHRGPGAAPSTPGSSPAGGIAARRRRQLPRLPAERIVGEPCGRDTAACIGLGAALIARHDPDAVMIVMPADHVIEPVAGVSPRRPRRRADGARSIPRALVTFGIPPTFPATGYGYIHRGAELPAAGRASSVFRVQAFREKPDADVGRAVARHRRVLLEQRHLRLEGGDDPGRALRQQPAEPRTPPCSASPPPGDTPQRDEVLRTRVRAAARRSASTTPSWRRRRRCWSSQAPFRWDDVGSWLALERMHPQDADGNTVLAQHAAITTKNCVIVGDPTDAHCHRRRREPAHRPGRRRHPGRRPPRRGGRQAPGRAAQEERAGEVPVSSARASWASIRARSASAWPSATPNAAWPHRLPIYSAAGRRQGRDLLSRPC